MRKTSEPRNVGLRMVLLPVLVLFFAGTLFGQSLADLARQERARKGQKVTQGRVFTNEDIPSVPSLPPAVASSAAPAAPAAGTPQEKKEGAETGNTATGKAEGATTAAGTPEAKPAPSPEKVRADLEKEYRGRFAKLREAQAYEEKKLDVMQRELNLMQTQFYSDPNVALREQTFRGQINQRTQELDQQKAVIEKAKQSISDLEEELRKKSLPPGWAR